MNDYVVSIRETSRAYGDGREYCNGNEEGFGEPSLDLAIAHTIRVLEKLELRRYHDVKQAERNGSPASYVEHISNRGWVVDIRMICPSCRCKPQKRPCKTCRVPMWPSKQRRKWFSIGTLPVPFVLEAA